MGEWVIGAFINLFGSIAINFGTNLLKLGLDEVNTSCNIPDLWCLIGSLSPARYSFFDILGNCLNFISLGLCCSEYLLPQPLLFLKHLPCGFLETTSHQRSRAANFPLPLQYPEVYTPEQLAEKYGSTTFLIYCLVLVIVVCLNHSIYRRGELLHAIPGNDIKRYWHMLLPLSYAIVSGAVGSCSVLFAKSLSNLLRLSISSGYQLHSWFTYSVLLLFLVQLDSGICIFPGISEGLFEQFGMVFDALRTTMFILGMISVFIGISLLAPDESKGAEIKDTPLVSVSANHPNDVDRFVMLSEESQIKDMRSLMRMVGMKAANLIVRIKAGLSLSLGLGEESIHASSVLVMPMVSSKITGFRGNGLDRNKLFSFRAPGWSRIDEEGESLLQTTTILPQSMK
ncbi:hypothetical protein DH2020_047512 [Rehmannia glutinosa]|uniref:Probable magnesium transporter n=1 Tax=Rehmannia glutinosa TaxID=99300 RepID=A0ABR0U8B7_REHGL